MISDIQRLSHSFPPDFPENTEYFANVHKVLSSYKKEIDPKKVYYRGIKNSSELKELRLLHKEWFPVSYPDEFFDELFKSKNYKSILATYEIEHKKQKTTVILGCITYEQKEVDFDFIRFTISDFFNSRYSYYILTFGVINEVRNKGIGSALIKHLIQEARENQIIKSIYLDVVHYNDQGIKCYEKNGFAYVMTKKEYYDIFDKKYDAYVYSLYINGGKKPLMLKKLLSSCCHKLNFPYHCYNAVKKCLKREKRQKQP